MEFSFSSERYSDKSFYRRCGKSGILLPAVSLGLWKNFGGQTSFSDARELLHFAFDKGITHFDLANNYGPPYGAAEETFGAVVKSSFASYRDELFVATKAGYDMWDGPYGNWGSRKYLIASLNQSLKRMNLEYVDLFYSHRYDPDTPLEETLQALVDVVRAGKALYVGISRWPLSATRFAFKYLRERDVPCLCYQGRLNLVDKAPVEEGIIDAVKEEGCGFVSFSPLAQGLLSGKYLKGIPTNSRFARDRNLQQIFSKSLQSLQLQQLNDFATRRSATLAQLALRWVLDQDAVTSVIVGASSKSQLAENLLGAKIPSLTEGEKQIIEQILSMQGQ